MAIESPRENLCNNKKIKIVCHLLKEDIYLSFFQVRFNIHFFKNRVPKNKVAFRENKIKKCIAIFENNWFYTIRDMCWNETNINQHVTNK